MLTPYFELNQTNEKLFILIHAPYTNLKDLEVYVDKDDFRFYSSPYYLRLHLPGHVKDCEEPSTIYDADNGQFNVELIKSTPGEEFKDLDLIAKFLSPQKNKKIIVKPDIQVLNSSVENDDEEDDDDDDDDANDSSDEWLIEQPEPKPVSEHCLQQNNCTFGFAGQSNNVFNVVKDEFREVFDAINYSVVTNNDFRKSRENDESEKFSDDHYLCDLIEPNKELKDILKYESSYEVDIKLSPKELDTLKTIGNKEYILSKEERRMAYLSLVDIIFSYAYDRRTTLGEPTVESAWTINKLSATLSWFQNYTSIKDVVTCCIRRSLCYPLYRHWKLALQVLDDTVAILKCGNRQILHCLLDIREMFNNSEPRYILNQLYINDYCVWLQKDQNANRRLSKLSDLIIEVKNTLQKQDVDLDIDVLEVAAYSTLEEVMAEDLKNVKINSIKNRKSNSSSSASSSDEERSTSTDSDSELDSDDDDDDIESTDEENDDVKESSETKEC